jgi:molybdopterin/thiamine biosynthesis adenylyltransferase
MKIRVIGCGGIGTCLLDVLSRYLNYHPKFKESGDLEVSLIDGDTYEERNRERQVFDALGNKADVTRERLQQQFPNIYFKSHPTYVSGDNVILLIQEGDVVFSGVDNHTTRKLLSDHCESLDNVVLISGGNAYEDGNIQIHIRKEGKNITLPIANEFHPEIVEPEDENPADTQQREGGCDIERIIEPQLVIANNAAAAAMLNAFYAYLQGKLDYDELYYDCVTGKTRPVKRRVKVDVK